MFYIVICDDDKNFIEDMKKRIINAGLDSGDVLFYSYLSGKELVEKMDKLKQCDLLILDMQMQGYDGHETARIFRQKFPKSMLVFCSGIRKPTDESFKTNPFRYLLKNYSNTKMQEEIDTIVSCLCKKKEGIKIQAKYYNNIVLIDADDVLYIENYRYGSIIHVAQDDEYSDKIITKKKLSELMEDLADLGYEYAHNSYIVNLKYVMRLFTSGEVTLMDGSHLNVSRSRMKQFRKSFSDWLSKKYE